jgi:broad specificity phosphatase PhoE
VKEFIEELKDSHPDKTVLCVTSGGVIRMSYKILLGEISPNISKHIMIKNGSIHEFKL